MGSFLDPSVSITNSMNSNICSTYLQGMYQMNNPALVTNRPHRSVEATVLIPSEFLK
jgi:hypothetical protein